ncbi:uncharacterized protein METZ01_LOCUS419629, partial [marine metagenome]
MTLLRSLQERVAIRLTPLRLKLEEWANKPWYDHPFGPKPSGTANKYQKLAEQVQMQNYPEI